MAAGYCATKFPGRSGLLRGLYNDCRLIALFPAIAVLVDYSLTFWFAGDTSLITRWEASPFVRFAVIHGVMAGYLAGIIVFYAATGYFVLRILRDTPYYRFGVILILTISIIHVIGGLSWYFRNAFYSNGVYILSLASIVVAFAIFGFSLFHERTCLS